MISYSISPKEGLWCLSPSPHRKAYGVLLHLHTGRPMESYSISTQEGLWCPTPSPHRKAYGVYSTSPQEGLLCPTPSPHGKVYGVLVCLSNGGIWSLSPSSHLWCNVATLNTVLFINIFYLVWLEHARKESSSALLSEHHQMLKKICQDFCDKELKPIAAKCDQEQRFPIEKVCWLFHKIHFDDHVPVV